MRLFRILGVLALFYLFFGLFYAISLALSIGSMEYISWRIVYLDYPMKALLTLPIWWLIFRRLSNHPLFLRIGLTVVLLPIWVKSWQSIYYYYIDNFTTSFRLVGPGEWWDVYIPALFYCIQFGVLFAVEYYQNFHATLLAKAESEKLVLAGELSALKAQLNPHFLYNSFNTISASVPPREEKTRELIAHLSDMFRYQLKASQLDQIPLAEEISFIEDYLTLEKARFGDRLRVSIAVPESLKHAAVPPLILQPLVENAVKHGIAPLMAGGSIHIEAQLDGMTQQLTLSVEDSGAGFSKPPTTPGTGIGLQNLRRRLDLLYGTSLQIDDRPGGGSRIHFSIPLIHVQESNPSRRRNARPETTPGIPSGIS